jgi:hypothetical protein
MSGFLFKLLNFSRQLGIQLNITIQTAARLKNFLSFLLLIPKLRQGSFLF